MCYICTVNIDKQQKQTIMTTQEIKTAVENKFGKADGKFSVRANGVWLKDGMIEVESVEAGFQGLFFSAIQIDVEIPNIEEATDEAAEAALEAKLREMYPDAENVWISVM